MIYAYLRVSSDRQDVNSQRIGVLTLAERKGLNIDEWITDDGISGTKEPEERQLGRILQKLKKDDVLLCSELSRLGRKLFMVMRILEHCGNIGCKLYSEKDNFELDDSIQSKVMAFAFGLSAEIERNMISLRTIEGLKRARQAGKTLGRPKGRLSQRTKLSDKKGSIKKYLNMGLSKNKIAKILGVHRLTMYSFIDKFNLAAGTEYERLSKTGKFLPQNN
ncbi:MAG: recombinase family protein [Elusimicrobiota bacterium]|jgi:DNA invertase Pin-like site-specific DNA recombinase|nr:recombinase family protein [Elusimicrobiota bacterium]